MDRRRRWPRGAHRYREADWTRADWPFDQAIGAANLGIVKPWIKNCWTRHEQVILSILAMALHALGAKAVSMTGPQAGIKTDAAHTRAKIMDLHPERVQEKLAEGIRNFAIDQDKLESQLGKLC